MELLERVPGIGDVSTKDPGVPFRAKPNFFYFKKCGRPCWLPVYPEPMIIEGRSVTNGWPCEAYLPHDRSAGDACYSEVPRDGDWVEVIGQVRGQELRNDILETSDIWNVIKVPDNLIYNSPDPSLIIKDGVLAFAADLWLGNTGWHDIPYKP